MFLVIGYSFIGPIEFFRGTYHPKVALIQGCIDAYFGKRNLHEIFYEHYFDLSKKAVEENKDLDLIVWPETFFRYPLMVIDPDACDDDPEAKKENLTGEQARRNLATWKQMSETTFELTAEKLGVPLLIGLDTQHYQAAGVKIHNSAAYVSKEGKILGRYDKKHLVMFGEYTPLIDVIPFLKYLTPLSMNITPGEKPARVSPQA